jgi:hypothetical protein
MYTIHTYIHTSFTKHQIASTVHGWKWKYAVNDHRARLDNAWHAIQGVAKVINDACLEPLTYLLFYMRNINRDVNRDGETVQQRITTGEVNTIRANMLK